jgi:2-hydroxy-3-keto-5-methylthiopentenyl-1-phosphate phosphatase
MWTALQAQNMPSPTEEIFEEIPRAFNIRWNFPNSIESIDAKHLRIHCLTNSGSQYFNYKLYHSIVLQAVVDAS